MSAASSGTADWAVDGERAGKPMPALTRPIVRNIAICVALQLSLTLLLPDQPWSMPLGLAGLCFLCALTALQIGLRQGQQELFGTIVLSGVFGSMGFMWIAFICEITWRNGEQSISCSLSLIHQVLMILFLVPRGDRFGTRWPAASDLVLGLVLCGLLTRTIWPDAFFGPAVCSSRYISYLTYFLFSTLGLASLYVQRRSPPMFLKAFVITQCIYALTSMLSVELAIDFQIPQNSPIWLYGDASMIFFPLYANATQRRRPEGADAKSDAAPSQAVPFVIALMVLGLAFGSAHRQQTLAAVIGVAGFILYSCRVAYVTRQYRRLQEALVVAGRARVESLIDVVHELRSPLASVVLNASALARSEEIPPRLKTRVDTIANRCGTVTRLLNDVLDLERIEAGLMDISVAPVDVVAACEEAIAAVATTAQAAGVDLHRPTAGGELFRAEGDAGLLMRVIVNLLDNAIRFTPTGGAVSVSIDRAVGRQIALVVEDSGVGLSPDAKATLFRRFGHAGDPVNGTKGSGLGLSISATAIEAMHGRLSLVARDDGPGTRATILLKSV